MEIDSSSNVKGAFVNRIETDRTKRFEFLLKQTELFSHFLSDYTRDKSTTSNKFGDLNGNEISHNAFQPKKAKSTEKIICFEKQPDFIVNCVMRDYQIKGLNWLIALYENGVNGILADEMGLGKTLQTISLLGFLKHFNKCAGPHIIIVPKSTLNNWLGECNKFCPSLRVASFYGNKNQRKDLSKQLFAKINWDILLTTYETCLLETNTLTKCYWHYIVIDEAHRIKNEKSRLAEAVRLLDSTNRLLITGTPLQNNLHELWSLLNFLMPDVFASSEDFDAWFNKNSCFDDDVRVKRLTAIFEPFLLRRLKSEVEPNLKPKKEIKIFVGLSEMQRSWYRKILMNDIDIIKESGKAGKLRFVNILMQLRKCTNHPYLFKEAEPGPPYITDINIVNNSGKMVVLDKLLRQLQNQGSRVLLFSQMTAMLDILEDYCVWRKYEYCRLDGQVSYEHRIAVVDEFNDKSSLKFIFLLSTRAGGLGINLTSADTVIIYDSDWNPHMDLQAMDRSHRIGQTKQVHIYRLIAEKTVDEKLVECAELKLQLSNLVMEKNATTNELLNIIRFGSEDFLQSNGSVIIQDEDMDAILERSSIKNGIEKTKTILSDKTTDESNTNDVSNVLSVRMRNINDIEQSIESNFKEPKKILDFQFHPPEVKELIDKELRYYRKLIGYKIENNPEEQTNIDNAEPLTIEEMKRKEELLGQGFNNWTKIDFEKFIHAIQIYGCDDIENIVKYIENKTIGEVRAYFEVLQKRFHELEIKDLIKDLLDIGTWDREKSQLFMKKILDQKMSCYRNPSKELRISYKNYKDENYTEAEDRFLLCELHKLDFDKPNIYDELFNVISKSKKFRYKKSLTASELKQRSIRLLLLIELEDLEKVPEIEPMEISTNFAVRRSKRSAKAMSPINSNKRSKK